MKVGQCTSFLVVQSAIFSFVHLFIVVKADLASASNMTKVQSD